MQRAVGQKILRNPIRVASARPTWVPYRAPLLTRRNATWLDQMRRRRAKLVVPAVTIAHQSPLQTAALSRELTRRIAACEQVLREGAGKPLLVLRAHLPVLMRHSMIRIRFDRQASRPTHMSTAAACSHLCRLALHCCTSPTDTIEVLQFVANTGIVLDRRTLEVTAIRAGDGPQIQRAVLGAMMLETNLVTSAPVQEGLTRDDILCLIRAKLIPEAQQREELTRVLQIFLSRCDFVNGLTTLHLIAHKHPGGITDDLWAEWLTALSKCSRGRTVPFKTGFDLYKSGVCNEPRMMSLAEAGCVLSATVTSAVRHALFYRPSIVTAKVMNAAWIAKGPTKDMTELVSELSTSHSALVPPGALNVIQNLTHNKRKSKLQR